MKKVITYGTFDLLHIGHINLLKRAKSLGDYLIVAISTDEFNWLKHKEAFYSFEERKQIVSSIKYVDEVIAENTWNQKQADIQKYNIDILVMGDDWQGEFDSLSSDCEVLYLPRTSIISTSKIKQALKNS